MNCIRQRLAVVALMCALCTPVAAQSESAGWLVGSWRGTMSAFGMSFQAELQFWRGDDGKLVGAVAYDGGGCIADLTGSRLLSGWVVLRESNGTLRGVCGVGATWQFFPAGAESSTVRVDHHVGPFTGTIGRADATAVMQEAVAGRRAATVAAAAAAAGAVPAPSPASAAEDEPRNAYEADWRRLRPQQIAAEQELRSLLQGPRVPLTRDLFNGELYRRLESSNRTALALTHLAYYVPLITVSPSVLLRTSELARRLQVPTADLDALCMEFDLALFALSASTRDKAIVVTLQREKVAWIALQERARGSDAIAKERYARVLEIAAASPGIQRVLEASLSHLKVWSELRSKARSLPSRRDARHPDFVASRYLNTLAATMSSPEISDIERVIIAGLSELDARDIPATDTDADGKAFEQLLDDDSVVRTGFDQLRVKRLLTAGLEPLAQLHALPVLEFVPPMVRNAAIEVPPDLPLRAQLADLERAANVALADIGKNLASKSALEALQTPEARARIDALALQASRGDKAALAQLSRESARIAADARLRRVAEVGKAYRAVMDRAMTHWGGEGAGSAVYEALWWTPRVIRSKAESSVFLAVRNAQFEVIRTAENRSSESRRRRREAEYEADREDQRQRALESCLAAQQESLEDCRQHPDRICLSPPPCVE